MSDGTSIGGFFATLAFNLRGVALVEGAVQAVERLNAATARRAKVHAALTEIYGDKNKAAALIGITADEGAIAADRAAKSAGRWGSALLAINQGMEVGLKIYGAVKAGINAVRSAVDASSAQASQALDLGQRLGIGVENVQRLGYAAAQSGTNLEELSGGMAKLANTLDNAKKGSKEAAAALHAVGLSKADAGKPLDQNLNAIADAFAKMPDGARKSALAMDLFGMSGAKLIPLLDKGQAGIKDLGDEADSTGYVIKEDAARALQGFGDATGKLSAQLAGVRNQVVVAVLPAIMKLVQGVSAWVSANRELLVSVLTGALKAFVVVLEVAFGIVKATVAVLGFLADHWEIVASILGAVTIMLAPLIAGFIAAEAAAVGAAIAAGVAWLVAAGPIILVGVAIAGLIYAVLRFRKYTFPVIEWIVDKWLWLGRTVFRVAKAYVGFWVDAAVAVKNVFVGMFDGVTAAVHWIMKKFDEVVARAKSIGREVGKKGILGSLADAVGLPGLSDIPGGGLAKSILKRTPGVGMLFGGNPFGLAGEGAASLYHRVADGSSGPTLPMAPAPAGNKTITQTNHVSISAPNANAKEVVALINDQLDIKFREAGAQIT